jgi:hypothetical protein
MQDFDQRITAAKFKEVNKKDFLIPDGIDKSGSLLWNAIAKTELP